jgi:SCY1-like protein 2
MSTINELSTKVHQQHLRHLQELKKLEDQTKSFAASSDPTAVANGTGSTLNDFEKLVGGGGGASASSGAVTPNSVRQSSSDNPFKIASDNPFSPSGGSQDSPMDMFGDMVRFY